MPTTGTKSLIGMINEGLGKAAGWLSANKPTAWQKEEWLKERFPAANARTIQLAREYVERAAEAGAQVEAGLGRPGNADVPLNMSLPGRGVDEYQIEVGHKGAYLSGEREGEEAELVRHIVLQLPSTATLEEVQAAAFEAMEELESSSREYRDLFRSFERFEPIFKISALTRR